MEFNKEISTREIYLTRYSIKDAPVTTSVPDSPVYYLQIDTLSSERWIHSDNLTGAPLLLDGSYTAVNLARPIHVASGPRYNTRTTKLRMRLCDNAGADASYSNVVLCFEFAV